MAAVPAPVPCAVYLENTVLVDLADTHQVRHKEAQELLALFQRHRLTGLLRPVTSSWAITECHSVLYDQELRALGIMPVPAGRHRRNVLPPNFAALNAAYVRVEALLHLLQTTTYDFFVGPDTTRDAHPLLQLSMRIAQEAGIWPTDSMHLAIALESDCSVIVTDDHDFLDKIECCQRRLITPYLRQRFSQLPLSPRFRGYGLVPTPSHIPRRPRLRRLSAMHALHRLGFR